MTVHRGFVHVTLHHYHETVFDWFAVPPLVTLGMAIVFMDADPDRPLPQAPATAVVDHIAFEDAPICMAIVSPSGHFLRVNRAYCRFLGYAKRDMMSLTIRDVTHPDDWKLSAQAIRRMHATGRPIARLEKRYLHKSGRVLWGVLRVREITGQSDNGAFTIAQVFDITEKKLAEQKQLETEAAYRSLFEDSVVGMTEATPDGRLLRVNKAMARMFGYESPEQMTTEVSDAGRQLYVNPESRRELTRELSQKGVLEPREVQVRRRDGTPFFALMSGREVPGANGAPVHYVGTHVDITRRQQAEQALRESEEEFKALFNGSSEAIMLLNTNGVVVKANAAMCTRFGIALQNFVGRNPFDSLPPVLARSRRAHFHQTLKTGKSRHFEDERDGRVMETHMYPTKGPSGKVTGIAILVRDITSLKQVEKTLRKSRDELELKVRERTVRLRALATELTKVEQKERRRIAHILHEDLQQRLVAMQYRIGNLKEAVQIGPASQTADRLLEDLTEAIQLTRNLTVRLSPPILFELGLIAALDWLADDMQSQFGLVISIKGPRAVTLASDEMRAFAFEAVRELLMNANKHSGIKAAELRIKTSGKHRITIEVRDKGRGMAESQSGEGKFGLFSIRERAQALGGNLGVTSHPGKGTCAALTLPTL